MTMQAITWTARTLANGLRVVVTPMLHSQAASLAMYVGVGSRSEARATLGLSHYLEHMLFKGTEKRPLAADISAEIEGAGGTLNAFTTKELTCFWNRVPYDRFDLAFDILSDSVQRSLLAPDEIERERSVIQQEIRRSHDEPGQRAFQLLSDAAYGDQPIGWDIAGDLDSVAAIQRDDLIQHIDRWYRPERMVLAVAGNVDPEHVFSLAEAEWSGQEARATGDLEPAQPEMAADRVLVEQRDIELCNVGIALRTFKRTDPDRYALSLLNEVLGRGMSSRLFLEVRERRGLAYSVGSGTARFSDTGHLSVGAGVTRENVEETVEVVLAELDRLGDEAVGDEELAKAREHAIGSFRLSLETASSWAHRTGESLLAEDKIRSPEEIVELFRGVTADDVRRVAGRFIRRDNVAISVVGPYDSPQALQAMIG